MLNLLIVLVVQWLEHNSEEVETGVQFSPKTKNQ